MSAEYMDMEEAVRWVMHAEKCSRERALHLIREAVFNGEIRATGVRSDNGKRERIPTRKPS